MYPMPVKVNITINVGIFIIDATYIQVKNIPLLQRNQGQLPLLRISQLTFPKL